MKLHDEEELGRINIGWITSCREIGLDEHVGREVIDPVTGVSYGYRKGNLEALAELLAEDNPFSRRFNLTAVIVDDNDTQYEAAWSDVELWPRNMIVPFREGDNNVTRANTLEELTIRIPSQTWKDLRRDKSKDESKSYFKARKAMAKADYEREILAVLKEKNIDILVSDSYVTIMNGVLLSNYMGRILNIHPAITDKRSPYRLPGLTPTRDAITRAKYGWIIVDDKKEVDIPEGREIIVNYESKQRRAVEVPRYNKTGVTVHLITPKVDDGPIVLSLEYEFDSRTETHESLRTKNYGLKREILPQALQMHIRYQLVQEFIMYERYRRVTKREEMSVRRLVQEATYRT